jgi:hypothetical protein
MATSTINQIIKEISDFQSAHRQVHSFGVGRIYDFASSGDTKYPSLWIDYGNASVNNVNMGGSESFVTLRIFIIDKLNNGNLNETEVRSDTQSICLDLIAYLSHPNFDWQIDSNISLVPIGEEAEEDKLAGWYFDLSFRQSFERDRCAIPFTSNPAPSQARDYFVRILDQDGNLITTVNPMSSYTVTVATIITDTIDANTATDVIIDNIN